MDISVVVPCFNEGESIPILYKRLKSAMDRLSQEYEILFVDDGSRDETLSAMKEAKGQADHIKILILDKHYGKDAALAAGFKSAEGQIIVTLDSDLQNYPEDIPLLLDKLKLCDGVIGWRKERKDNFLKKISSRTANAFRNSLLSEDLHDAGCGLRAFRKECLKKLGSFQLFDLFLMSMFKIKGFKVTEVIVRHAPREWGHSKFNIRNRLFRNGAALMEVWWLKRHGGGDVPTL
ncbi:MAG: glycosyltransferase family 2 protein [Candidatus Omnitrophota bacterium]